jgi:hypothetical protein
MFDLHTWQNPETLMLNLMNSMLGLAIVVVAAAIGWKLVRSHRDKESTHLGN